MALAVVSEEALAVVQEVAPAAASEEAQAAAVGSEVRGHTHVAAAAVHAGKSQPCVM